MSTQAYYFRGICKWAMVHSIDEKYNNYKVNLYMDDSSKELFASSGLQMTPKTDEDGEYVTFRRAASKSIKGETVNFGKPKVLGVDTLPTNDLIGNGSDVTIKVVAFDTLNGIGHRLEAVKVNMLIPYEGKAVETHTPEGWEEEMPF